MQLRPTNDFKDKFVAPEISSFTEASISDLSGLRERWLVSFILNSSLVVQLDDATRRTIYNFLRQAEAAFREYSSGRQMTLAHLANPNPDAVSEYIIAIGHWEVFLSHEYQAWCLLARGQKILFTPGDGSTMQRLNLLYNRTKHAESAITAKQLPPDGTLPVWLKNDGLHSVGAASRSRRSRRCWKILRYGRTRPRIQPGCEKRSRPSTESIWTVKTVEQ